MLCGSLPKVTPCGSPVCSARCFKTFESGYEIFEAGYEIFEAGYEIFEPGLETFATDSTAYAQRCTMWLSIHDVAFDYELQLCNMALCCLFYLHIVWLFLCNYNFYVWMDAGQTTDDGHWRHDVSSADTVTQSPNGSLVSSIN